MDFMDLVKQRVSVRKYSSKPVSRELIDQCLEAARLAPSASNSQPWSFIVVDDEKIKNEMVKKSMSGIYSSNKFVMTAPVIIVAITEHSTYITRLGAMLRNVKYNLIDIGIACEHFVLQAEELGLGTCWLGWFDENAVKEILDLSKSTKVDVMISLGYPAEDLPAKKRIRKSLDEMRRYY